MPNKRPPKQTKSNDVRLLVADEFRTESSGKVLGVGIYPDLVIILRVPRNAPEPSKEVPYGVDISLLITVIATPGEYDVKASLGNFGSFKQHIVIGEGRSANVIANAKPLLVQDLGAIPIKVSLNDELYEFQIEIRKQVVDEVRETLYERISQPLPSEKKPATKRTPRRKS